VTSLLAAFIVEPMAFVGAGWSGFMAFFSITRIRDLSDIPAVTQLPADVIDDGEWEELDGAWQYRLNIETEYLLKKVIIYIIVKSGSKTDIIYAAKGSNGVLDVMTPDRTEHINEFDVSTLGISEYG